MGVRISQKGKIILKTQGEKNGIYQSFRVVDEKGTCLETVTIFGGIFY